MAKPDKSKKSPHQKKKKPNLPVKPKPVKIPKANKGTQAKMRGVDPAQMSERQLAGHNAMLGAAQSFINGPKAFVARLDDSGDFRLEQGLIRVMKTDRNAPIPINQDGFKKAISECRKRGNVVTRVVVPGWIRDRQIPAFRGLEVVVG